MRAAPRKSTGRCISWRSWDASTKRNSRTMCLGIGLGVEEPVLRTLAQKAGAEELLRLKEALEQRMAEMMPMQSQLMTSFEKSDAVESGYLI